MTSDEQLILELKQGSEPAFTELFLRYRECVWAFFRRRMNDAAQAEELAQETFLAVLKGTQRYQPRATFRAYLFGIAFHILAAHRRKSVNDQKSMDVAPDEVPARAGTNQEHALCVWQAVERLEGGEREVLMLREFEELSYQEIAKILCLPLNTVRSRLFRARMALRDILTAAPGSLGGRK
jgi:RNA polymerase sigma-70 factor (ECF subfamily)